MKAIDVYKRDSLLVDYIFEHKGSENAVSKYEIAKHLKENGFTTYENSIHTLITRIKKERHLPICSLNGNGYYWAKNKQDILVCISHLEKRIKSLQEHIKHLENFIME